MLYSEPDFFHPMSNSKSLSKSESRDSGANTKVRRIMSPASNHGEQRQRPKVAIVGSGCAGLGALWALQSTEYEVHLFEKSDMLGGHTNTQLFRTGDRYIPVDTGFIVMNTATYPNFIRFLKEVGVKTVKTEMTFSVSRDKGKFEWSGETQGVFAQRRNLFRWRYWKMIFDIVRFNQFALDILVDEQRCMTTGKSRKYPPEMSIGDYLNREGYSQAFCDDYLIPMTAAVWSTSPDKASLEFPAATLIRFMWNHHLLSTLADRPPWLTIPGGSQKYIDAIVKQFPRDRLHIHTSCEVANVLRPSGRKNEGDVMVSWIDTKAERVNGDGFQHVVLACHGDQVIPLLAKSGSRPPSSQKQLSNTTSAGSLSQTGKFECVKSSSGVQYLSGTEYEIFSAFRTTNNLVYLHSDLSLMPTRRACWAAWNYLTTSPSFRSKSRHPTGVALTYCMNILQHVNEKQFGPVLVTMNPPYLPDPELTQKIFSYRHPLYTAEAVRAQFELEKIQGHRGVSYAGAWTGYGFHEDGFSSGLKVAIEHLGAKLPFDFVNSKYSRGRFPVLTWKDRILRMILSLMLIWMRLIEWIVKFVPGLHMAVHIMEALWTQGIALGELIGLW